VPDLQSGGCGFQSQPGLLRTKVYSAFHPSWVGKWVPAAAGKAKAGMSHSDCGWTCGCAGKTMKSIENTCHTWALLRWWFTTKRRYIKCMHLYLYLHGATVLYVPFWNNICVPYVRYQKKITYAYGTRTVKMQNAFCRIVHMHSMTETVLQIAA